jgi:molybdopterin synthase catalytic subunit
MVRVLYFAAARDRAGTSSEDLDVGGRTVGEIVLELVARHPRLADVARQARVAVNQRFAHVEERVPDGAELALIPPVAGG